VCSKTCLTPPTLLETAIYRQSPAFGVVSAAMDDGSKLVVSSEAHHSRTPRVIAAAVSSVFPGIGQVLLGKTRAGIGFLCALGLLVLLYWPLRLPRSYFGMLLVMFLTAGLFTLAGWNTLRTPAQHTVPGSRWWLLLLVPLAFKASFWNNTRLLPLIGLHAFYVPSGAMEPTVIVGDYVIADLTYYRESKPKANDVVVIQRGGTSLIKRVMATVGDTVEGKDDLVFVNGHLLKEPYVEHIGGALHVNQFGPVNVMPQELFVLGDNRDNSIDSRAAEFGAVTESSVAGRVLYVVRRPKWWRTGQNLVANTLRSLRPHGRQ
jgi:signal peptidase I